LKGIVKEITKGKNAVAGAQFAREIIRTAYLSHWEKGNLYSATNLAKSYQSTSSVLPLSGVMRIPLLSSSAWFEPQQP
jgi:hypothetical protein